MVLGGCLPVGNVVSGKVGSEGELKVSGTFLSASTSLSACIFQGPYN